MRLKLIFSDPRAAFTASAKRGLVVAAALLLTACIPSTANLLPTSADPLRVIITDPQNGSDYPFATGLSVRVEALTAEPIASLELWVDGILEQEKTMETPEQKYVVEFFPWEVPALGEHTLVARVIDTLGRIEESGAVHITSIQPPGAQLVHPVQEGETLKSIAEQYGVDPAALQVVDPNAPAEGIYKPPGPPTEPLALGLEVFVPLSSPQIGPSVLVSDPLPTEFDNPSSDINSFGLWLDQNLPGRISSIPRPAAPNILAGEEGCQPTLFINDQAQNENGFFVYRVGPGQSNFERVAAFGSHDGSLPVKIMDEEVYGNVQYYVASFNAAGEMASNLVSLNLPQVCAPSPLPSLNELVDFNLQEVDELYTYLKVGDGDWQRVPADDQVYLHPATDSLTLTSLLSEVMIPNQAYPAIQAYLHPAADSLALTGLLQDLVIPTQADTATQGEVWGWKGGVLTSLGSFQYTVPADALPIFPFYIVSSPTLEVGLTAIPDGAGAYIWGKEKGFSTYGQQIFRLTLPPYADGLIWQVSVQPFSTGFSLNPPGLVLPGTYGPATPGEKTQFPINFAGLDFQKFTYQQAPLQGEFQVSPSFADPSKNLGCILITVGEVCQKIDLFPDPIAEEAEGEQKIVPTWYVRAMPTSSGQVVGVPSNTVILQYSPQKEIVIVLPPPPPPPPYEARIVAPDSNTPAFTPVHFADPIWQYCLEVTKVVPHLPSPADFFGEWANIKPGDVRCPKPETGESYQCTSLGCVLTAFEKTTGMLFDKASEWYAKATGVLVDVVEFFISPACMVAGGYAEKIAEGGQTTADKICHAIAVYSVEAAKAYFGLPPSLPNWDQVKGLGKDYLVQLAADEMEANGIPCPQECKDILGDGLDELLEEMTSESTRAVWCGTTWDGYKPLCPPQWVKTRPDPRGQYAPAVAWVEVTRKPGIPDSNLPVSCDLSVSTRATNDFWIGKGQPYASALVLAADYEWQGQSLADTYEGTWAEPTANHLLNTLVSMPIPQLAEGQTLRVPVALNRVPFDRSSLNAMNETGYWLPGHWTKVSKSGLGANYDDWHVFYHGAMISISASGSGYFAMPTGNVSGVCVEGRGTFSFGPLGIPGYYTSLPPVGQ